MKSSSIVTARLRRAPPVFICKKCLGRIDDGKQLRKSLKSGLKTRGTAQGTKAPRLVLTGCLGICPKRAVVTTSAEMLHQGQVLLLANAGESVGAAKRLMPERGHE
jgi:hypothetical protein